MLKVKTWMDAVHLKLNECHHADIITSDITPGLWKFHTQQLPTGTTLFANMIQD